jgi:quinol monooxygenase YgiN
MRSLWLVLLAGAILTGLIRPAQAQATPGQAVYAVTSFDVAPAQFGKAADLLRQFAAATRKEDGNIELTALDEVGRTSRFVIIEAWRDKARFDAHGAAMKALGDELQPFFIAPFSTRPYAALSVAATPPDANLGTAMYVVTHVDVFPAGKDETNAAVKQLAADSRKDKGEERFDALIWEEHPNHFELIEAWTNHQARETHALADHTKAFRAKLTPFEGAPYDERLYEVVR